MSSRKTIEGISRVYDAAQEWVNRALRDDDSLFILGETIWSRKWLTELYSRYREDVDTSIRGFYPRLEKLLEGSPPEVYQLMAEVLYFHMLIQWTRNGAGKRNRVNQVVAWSGQGTSMPEELEDTLTPGVATIGPALANLDDFLGFLIEFVARWKEENAAEQHRLLEDPWAFKDFTRDENLSCELFQPYLHTIQRHALLHLVFPDTFEPIVSDNHKSKLATRLAVGSSETDSDRAIYKIRLDIENTLGRDFDFYDNDAIRWWDPFEQGYGPPYGLPIDAWDDFVRRARRFVASGRLEEEEIEYKVEMGDKLGEARQSVLAASDDWVSLVKRGIGGNLIFPIEQKKFRDWLDESPDDALTALQFLWTESEVSQGNRVREFCEFLPRSASGGVNVRTTLASVLLMGLGVQQCPPYRVTVLEKAYGLTDYILPEPDTDEAGRYEHAMRFLDRFIDEAGIRGVQLRHRLDAQSVIWGVLRSAEDEEDLPDGDDNEEDPQNTSKVREPLPDPWSPDNIGRLAKDLLWEPDHLQMVVDDLKEKRQVIFYGPPGTGKTYVAREIAKQCRLNGGNFEIVQFHPSYAYEDFVQGFRPRLFDGQPGFTLEPGPLHRIAEAARKNENATFILVIDELNRGNVAKVFGELYFLLEYRNEEVQLQYGMGSRFRLPPNLWFICTMNTADRSIALMDAALRRRFFFTPFFSDEPPIKDLLRRWLGREGHGTWVADLVDSANSRLDRDMGIGPSYFMTTGDLDEQRIRRIWRRSVLPYIEEQFFGDADKLAEFDLDRLIAQLSKATEEDTLPESLNEITGTLDKPEASDG